MGLPSYFADIEDRAADNETLAGVFASGTAGAAGIGRHSREVRQKWRPSRSEAEARSIEERTRRLVDDKLVWIEATAGVLPLRKRR